MENRMDSTDQPSKETSFPLSPKDELLPVSPPDEELPTLRKERTYLLSTKKVAFFSGLILLIIFGVILGVRYLHTLPGNQKWSFHANGAISASPIVANGIVYVCTEPDYPDDDLTLDIIPHDIFYALDAASGNRKWSFMTDGRLSSSPVVVNGIVYVSTTIHISSGGSIGMLYALNAASGHVQWSSPIGSALNSSPIIANGIVYVVSRHGTLDALDAVSGKQKWSFLLGIKGDAASLPTVVNGTVYLGTNNGLRGTDLKGTLYALDAASGQKRWSYQATGGLFIVLKATADSMYVSFGENRLSALDSASGTVKWSVPTENGIFSSPTVVNGIIYVVDTMFSGDGTLYAFDVASGTMKWSHQATVGSTPFGTAEWSPPVVVNGVIYATSNADTIDDNVYAFDAISGRKIWSHSVEGPTPYALTAVNGTIYMSSLNSVVLAFDALSGQEKWSYATGAIVQSSPTVANGIVYVGANDGTLHAIFS